MVQALVEVAIHYHDLGLLVHGKEHLEHGLIGGAQVLQFN